MPAPILVTSATGKTGGHVVRLLVEQGVPVRAAVRSPERAARDARLAGAELVEFDFDRPETFAPASAGCRAAYVAIPFGRAMNRQGEALHEALGQRGLERIVRLSIATAYIEDGIDMGRWHRDLDDDLYQHCESPVFLRPEAFMQNLLGMAPAISNGVLQAATGDGASAYIDAVDVAAVAVKALTDSSVRAGVYDLTGPDAYSLDGLAELVSEVFDVPVRSETVSLKALEAKYTKVGMPEWLVRTMGELQESTAAKVAGTVSDAYERVMGEPPKSLRAFLEEHREQLLGEG